MECTIARDWWVEVRLIYCKHPFYRFRSSQSSRCLCSLCFSPFRRHPFFRHQVDSHGKRQLCCPLEVSFQRKIIFQHIFIFPTAKDNLPFLAMIFWQTIGTLTSPASKKSMCVISFNQSPTPCPMTDGLQFYKGKKNSISIETLKVKGNINFPHPINSQ